MDASSRTNVVRLNPLKSHRGPPLRRVSKGHQSNRVIHLAEYLEFVAEAILRRRSDIAELRDSIKTMKQVILAQKPKTSGQGPLTDPELKAPAPEVFETMMDIVREDSDLNPYRDYGVRFRNALMFEVMYHTGIRAGELLSLRIEDMSFSVDNAQIHVRRRHDDPIDPRLQQPVAKTLERRIPIPTHLAKRIRSYIMDVRAHIPRSTEHPFLFVTHHAARHCQGRPISDSTFRNRILAPAVQSNPELFEEITRHGFRHNFNYRLSKKIDQHNQKAEADSRLQPIGEKEEIQIRKQLNGWKSDASAVAYNLRHVEELANVLMKEDAEQQNK